MQKRNTMNEVFSCYTGIKRKKSKPFLHYLTQTRNTNDTNKIIISLKDQESIFYAEVNCTTR